MTAQQLFRAACREALDSKVLRGMPVEKVLNRLDFSAEMEIQHALAQQFIVLIRNAAEGVNVNRPLPTIAEQIAQLAKMRDVEGQPLPTPDEEGGKPARSAASSRRVCIDLKPASTALVPRAPRGGNAK